MKQRGFVSTELILMIALSLFLVLVGTRAVRNLLYPQISKVQMNFKQYAECGEAEDCQDYGDSFEIKGIQ